MTQCLWCKGQIVRTYSFFELFIYAKDKGALCDYCRSELVDLKKKVVCEGCGRKQEITTPCLDCEEWKKQYPTYDFKHAALFSYNTFAKEYMEQYKIMGDCELAGLYARDMREAWQSRAKTSLVIPIPISEASQKKRGFNQTVLLLDAAEISYKAVLENVGRGEKQSKKDKNARMHTCQPFKVLKEYEKEIAGKEVILVDDIYTTGRTMFHASASLQPFKPSRITSVSLFR